MGCAHQIFYPPRSTSRLRQLARSSPVGRHKSTEALRSKQRAQTPIQRRKRRRKLDHRGPPPPPTTPRGLELDWGVASCPVRPPVCLYTNSAAWPKKGTDPLPDVQTSFISRDWAGACPLFWAKPQFRPATIPPISARCAPQNPLRHPVPPYQLTRQRDTIAHLFLTYIKLSSKIQDVIKFYLRQSIGTRSSDRRWKYQTHRARMTYRAAPRRSL